MSGKRSHLEPMIGYQQAMRSYVVLDHTVHIVGDDELPIGPFKVMLLDAAMTVKKPDKVKQSIAGLSFYERMDRWFALDTLAEYGATLPLFATEAEAWDSVQVPQCLTSA